MDAPVSDLSPHTIRHLAVAWQHPVTRSIQPVGLLDRHGAKYRFRYVRNVRDVKGFGRLLEFPDLDRTYESPRLFPLFTQRIMSARRPDYTRYLARLHLEEDAGPLELLARSGGRRMGDTIQLFPEPWVGDDGSTSVLFLVHGIRHVLDEDPTADQRFDQLTPGQPLDLVEEPDNPINQRALLVTAHRQRLGWVPDLLLDYLHMVMDHGEASLAVEHVNGPEAPPHLRLLVRLEGRAPVGYRPFSGPKWEPVG